MQKFIVTVGADKAEPIITETVDADNPNDAMRIVLDRLKFDKRVMDEKTWNVTITEATNA